MKMDQAEEESAPAKELYMIKFLLWCILTHGKDSRWIVTLIL